MSKSSITMSGGERKTAKDCSIRYAPYFKRKAVYFTANSSAAFINKMKYQMDYPSLEIDEVMMVSLKELAKIFCPDMQVSEIDDGYKVVFGGKEARFQIDNIVFFCGKEPCEFNHKAEIIDGQIYVDVESLMTKAFGMQACWENTYLAPGDYLGLAERTDDLFEIPNVIKDMIIQTTKRTGLLRCAYYYEKANIIQPYILYIPTTYQNDRAWPLTVFLHGAGGGVDSELELNKQPTKLEREAELHGHILLLAEGYTHGFYGGGSPELHPETATEEEQKYFILCEQEIFEAMGQVMERYCVDQKNIFLFGNSMGGGGTFWLAKQYPGFFRAIAPCGALTTQDMDCYDLKSIKGLPILLVCGTENIGYDNLPLIAAALNSSGAKASICTVPGGIHPTAWTYALGEIFDFFQSNRLVNSVFSKF